MFGGTFDLPRSGEYLRTDMDVRNQETREAEVGLEVGNTEENMRSARWIRCWTFGRRRRMSCISEQPDQGKGSIIGRIKGYMELRSFDGLQRKYLHYEGSTIMDGPLVW